jgi:hypothetical protein
MNFINRFKQLDRDFQILFGILLIVTIVSLIFAFRKSPATLATPVSEEKAVLEMKKIVEEVGKVMVLPTDESPTLATVTNPEALKSQPFFAKALEGDKVLIYTTVRKAILWRPSTHKIIEVSDIDPNAVPKK